MAYFKRFRMEIDLGECPALPLVPAHFAWLAWQKDLLEPHADVLFRSFDGEIDAVVFPSFGDRIGCTCLIREISQKPGFLPGATWLLTDADGPCGTVQGVCERSGVGAIQNLGVVPLYRGQGLGSALLLQALLGFRRAGLRRAFLEVTAQNDAAVRLYHRLGFRRRKTLYKAVAQPACVFAGV